VLQRRAAKLKTSIKQTSLHTRIFLRHPTDLTRVMLQEGFTEEAVVPLAKMAYNTPDHTFVLLAREANSLEFGTIVATLRFTVKEIDPSTGKP